MKYVNLINNKNLFKNYIKNIHNNTLFILFFLENITKLCLKYINKIYLLNNDNFIIIQVNDLKYVKNFLNILKNFFFFSILSDMICIDFLKRNDIFNETNSNRFKVIYVLNNLKYNMYLGVCIDPKKNITNNDEIISIENLWKNANWLERENWDMFGIVSLNHKDLRRIFTDYGFNGFPLRKDFPLSGYIELRYDDETKTLIYEPVEFSQEYRNFSFINSWDIYTNV
jgi:NADH:ubiquinone oxidoreductase subunit C